MNFAEQLDKYAKLAVKLGVNLQPGQLLIVRSSIDAAPLVRLIAKHAYQIGAKRVHVDWSDAETGKMTLQYAPGETLQSFPQWIADGYEEMARSGAAVLNILAPHPGLLADLDAERVATEAKARRTGLKAFNEYVSASRISWSIVAYTNDAWAQKLFPGLDVNAAVEKLWEHIFYITRVDQADPIAAWKKHTDTLAQKLTYLNQMQFRQLHYRAPGTDLTVELPDKHLWLGGGSKTPGGTVFMPNIPTEEVFTLPRKDGVNGVVKSTKPLSYVGQVIDDFSMTFVDGRVTNVEAKQGLETLQKLLETDEGARYLGEVALVPHDSPISQLGLVFDETLIDENASNHLALGQAYPICIQDGEQMSEDELISHGVNMSLTHVDFMIGSEAMDIDAQTSDGTWIPLFRNGNWA